MFIQVYLWAGSAVGDPLRRPVEQRTAASKVIGVHQSSPQPREPGKIVLTVLCNTFEEVSYKCSEKLLFKVMCYNIVLLIALL